MCMVSVIMSVYNSEKYLKESIESILNQTYKDIEFIIINDGSEDNSLKIINSYNDKRIKIVNNYRNIGLISSLNKGIDIAKGKYIARMDSDDISAPNRLDIQVRYLERHEEISMVSSGVIMFSNRFPFIKKIISVEKSNEELKCELIFKNRIFHPTVMFRKSVIISNNYKYNKSFEMCEDFGLWQLLSFHNKISVINDCLLKYRMESNSITSNSRKYIGEFYDYMKNVYNQGLNLIGIKFSDKELDIHTEISMCSYLKSYNYSIVEKEAWLKKLYYFNKKKKVLNINLFKNIICSFFYNNCIQEKEYQGYKKSFLYDYYSVNRIEFYKDVYKSILKSKLKPIIW